MCERRPRASVNTHNNKEGGASPSLGRSLLTSSYWDNWLVKVSWEEESPVGRCSKIMYRWKSADLLLQVAAVEGG